MKKVISGCMVIVMALGLAACGGSGSGTAPESTGQVTEAVSATSQQEKESTSAWTSEGFYDDGKYNTLFVQKSDDEKKGAWYAIFTVGNDYYGGYLAEDGKDLKGSLSTELEGQGKVVTVTISEDGQKGLTLTVEGGDTYNFKPSDGKESPITVSINTDGLGYFNAVTDGYSYKTEDDYSSSSAIFYLDEPATYTLSVKPEEGWKFIKWTINGDDYSTDEKIVLEISESADIIAVFDVAGN